MGQLPPVKDFSPETFPKIPAPFLTNLSQAIRIIVETLTKAVNFDNISGANFPRVLLQAGRNVTPDEPLKLKLPDNQRAAPVSVYCGGVWRRNSDARDAIGVVISIEWDYDSVEKQIIIKRINGLPQPYAVDYQITITAFGA